MATHSLRQTLGEDQPSLATVPPSQRRDSFVTRPNNYIMVIESAASLVRQMLIRFNLLLMRRTEITLTASKRVSLTWNNSKDLLLPCTLSMSLLGCIWTGGSRCHHGYQHRQKTTVKISSLRLWLKMIYHLKMDTTVQLELLAAALTTPNRLEYLKLIPPHHRERDRLWPWLRCQCGDVEGRQIVDLNSYIIQTT